MAFIPHVSSIIFINRLVMFHQKYKRLMDASRSWMWGHCSSKSFIFLWTFLLLYDSIEIYLWRSLGNQSWDNFLSLSFMDDSLTICNIIPLIWIVIIFSLITNRPLSLVNISSFFSLFLYRKVVCCWVPLDTNRLSILNEREEILR